MKFLHKLYRNPEHRYTYKYSARKGITEAKELRKERHSKHLTNFATALHGIGANVQKHAADLGIEQEELDKAVEKFEAATFIKSEDRRKLESIIENLKGTMGDLVNLESAIWDDARKPITSREIMQVLSSFDIDKLEMIGALSTKRYKKKLNKAAAYIVPIRQAVIDSIEKHEHKKIFKQYPALLEKIERDCKGLVELEKKWKKGGKSRDKILQIHYDIRKILQEDVTELSQDILGMYQIRARIYDWMVAVAQKTKLKWTSQLVDEQKKIHLIWNHYMTLFETHQEKLRKIYGVGGG